jgi:hypothetical protein
VLGSDRIGLGGLVATPAVGLCCRQHHPERVQLDLTAELLGVGVEQSDACLVQLDCALESQRFTCVPRGEQAVAERPRALTCAERERMQPVVFVHEPGFSLLQERLVQLLTLRWAQRA